MTIKILTPISFANNICEFMA